MHLFIFPHVSFTSTLHDILSKPLASFPSNRTVETLSSRERGMNPVAMNIINRRKNLSVENAGVAFVKGANERNEFFEKNKQTVISNEQVRTNKAEDQQSQGRTDLGTNSVR